MRGEGRRGEERKEELIFVLCNRQDKQKSFYMERLFSTGICSLIMKGTSSFFSLPLLLFFFPFFFFFLIF